MLSLFVRNLYVSVRENTATPVVNIKDIAGFCNYVAFLILFAALP